jgi:hypothetical protein
MNKQVKSTTVSTLNPSLNAIPWWKKPVLGKGSLLEDLHRKICKSTVPEGTIFLHNRQITKASIFAKAFKAIDNEKFGSPEFLYLVKLRYLIFRGLEEYQGLYQNTELLKVAIATKTSFIALDQTELRYRSSKQQEFYDFVEKQLKDNQIKKINFRQEIQVKLNEVIPQIKTKEGKIALQSYSNHLNNIAEHSLGLKLLARFKNYQFNDYSILQKVADITNNLSKENLLDFKSLIAVVMANYDDFEGLGTIIDLDPKSRTPETYAKMLQYIALNHKHQLSFGKFAELVSLIKRWYPFYQAIFEIRKQYSPSNYRQPPEFQQPIPGEEIYWKYQQGLTDSKTGRIYIDFSQENQLSNRDGDQFF